MEVFNQFSHRVVKVASPSKNFKTKRFWTVELLLCGSGRMWTMRMSLMS